MDDKKREELKAAYHTMCEYMLWRKGRTDKLSFDEKEIGVAFEIATGAILDYISCDAELHTTQISLNSCEQALGELRQKHKELELRIENCESSDPTDPEEAMILDQSVFDSFGPEFKYAAVDSNGECWVYHALPLFVNMRWISSEEDATCYRVDGRFNTEYWDREILARGIGALAVRYDQLVFDKADPRFKYAAVDQDFQCFLYVERPVLCAEEGRWKTSQPRDMCSFSFVGEYAVVDWENSLMCRQKNTSDASEQESENTDVSVTTKKKLEQSIFQTLDNRYKYAAVALGGYLYAFTRKPRISRDCWVNRGGEFQFLGTDYDDSTWKESLLKREVENAGPKEPLDQSILKLIDRKYKLDQSVFKLIDRKYKYAAVHSDGFAYAFTTKPRVSNGFWYRRGEGETLFLGEQYDASSWKESLIKREN